MNEERGTRDDRRAQAGPGTGQGPSDGHQVGPALEHGGSAPGQAGAGSWAGADGPAGTGVRGGPAPAGQQGRKRSKGRSWWIELPILLAFGEDDARVPVVASAQGICGAVAGGRSGAELTLRVFPGADHSFRLAPTPGAVWPRTAPGYVESLVGWVARVTGGVRGRD